MAVDLRVARNNSLCTQGIALRSVKHAWHGVTVIFFYGLVVLGLSSSALYRKLTPDMSVLFGPFT